MKSFVILFALMFASWGLAQSPPAAQKPLDKDQVMALVTAGMDNAQLAKRIEELGIDFEPSDDYLQALRKAGAQDVLIHALRPAKAEPMNQQQVPQLVAGGVPSERAAALVKQRGIDFVADEKYLETLRVAGADETLITAVREASAAIPARLEVETAPNAEIFLDGAPAGRADSGGSLAVEKVKPGVHVLRITLSMKKDFEQSVTVNPGVVNKVAATLASLPGRIVVSSTPGAQVYLDNVSRGKTDADGKLVLADVAPGSHPLRVTAPATKDYQETVNVSDGQEASIRAFGEPLPGSTVVQATPGAKVFFDDYRAEVVLANGKLSFTSLHPGSHSVRVVTEGQADFRRNVTLEPGADITLDTPRFDVPRPAKGIDRLYRNEADQEGFRFYMRFYPDGFFTWIGTKGSLADAEREIQEDKSTLRDSWVYQMQGSTIRFQTNGWTGIATAKAIPRGSTLTIESVDPDGKISQNVFTAVDSDSEHHARRH